jgi:hypothetical protein
MIKEKTNVENTVREATSDEVNYGLKPRRLKRPWVRWFWKTVYSKKAYSGMGRPIHEVFSY